MYGPPVTSVFDKYLARETHEKAQCGPLTKIVALS
jgi:hypothetical protein